MMLCSFQVYIKVIQILSLYRLPLDIEELTPHRRSGVAAESPGLEEAQAGIKIAGRNVNNLRYADDTTLWQKVKRN